MLRLEHYFSYVIHPSWQIFHPQQKFYMDILHKEQFFQDHQNVSIYPRFGRNSSNFRKNRKKTSTKPHRAKDLHVLKVKEKVQFFPNKQGTGPLQWITGTVTEILECGCSYMVQAPNGRVYRRNRAHLKPICHDGLILSRPFSEKREETAQKQFLSRPSAQQGEICVFPEGHKLYGHQIHVV